MGEDKESTLKESPVDLSPIIKEIHGKTEEEIAQKLYDARVKATKDPMTGLLNKESWLEASQRVLEEDRRIAFKGSIKNSSLMVIDLDGFKELNDNVGHQAGDHALKTFADILNQTVTRKSDVISRLGGDEFGVFLPRTIISEADQLKERILLSLKEVESPQEGNVFAVYPLRASIGVTEIVKDETFLQALDRADKLMYKEKRKHNNG